MAVDSILSYLAAQQRAIAVLIGHFVECESPSDDPAAVNRFVEMVADMVAPVASVKTHDGGKFGKHLVCEMQLPGPKNSGQVLVLGHSDTVWPMGTLCLNSLFL